MPVGLSRAATWNAWHRKHRPNTPQNQTRRTACSATATSFHALYAIRTGFFQNLLGCCNDGREQVTGFQMAGEIIGLDGIVSDRHSCDAVALEDAGVCASCPLTALKRLSREVNALQHHVHKIMSREIVLLNTASCCSWAGCVPKNVWQPFCSQLGATSAFTRASPDQNLAPRMTREEIGSYLGLKLETVSRHLFKICRRWHWRK
jgi:CRP/FNR family transcriptional regulator